MIRPIRQFFSAIRQKLTPAQKRYPWLQHYPEDIPWDAEIPARPLHSLLVDAAANYAENTAIDFLGKTYTYREVERLARRFAAGLQQMGIRKGDRVGLFLPNSPHFIISYYGILMAGGVVVNFNPLYPAKDVARQIQDSGVKAVVTFALKSLLGKLETCRREAPIETIIAAQFTEALPFPKNLLFPVLRWGEVMPLPSGTGYAHFADLAQTDAARLQAVEVNPEEDVAVLQYTGGTTGVPKGAMLTHANLYANTVQAGMWFSGMEEGRERMLAVLPCFHVFAMTVVMNISIHKGLELQLYPQFNLHQMLKGIAAKKPTLMVGVPTIFNAINHAKNLDKYDLSSLKMAFSGGAGLPVEIKDRFESLTGCRLVEGYGLTESSPVAAGNPLFGTNKASSIGVPLPATIIEIVGMDGRDKGLPLPIGKTGEICIRGPQVMKGYWNRPEETARCLKDGLLHTGDVGYMDADGYFFLVDRLKEMIISGGYNIYPRNIEEVLYTHPDVMEAAVIGVEDAHWGQRVKAYVALNPGSEANAAELQQFCRDKLPRFAWPAEIEFRQELPKTMIGKISKKDL